MEWMNFAVIGVVAVVMMMIGAHLELNSLLRGDRHSRRDRQRRRNRRR